MNWLFLGLVLAVQATSSPAIVQPTLEQAYSTTTVEHLAGDIADQFGLNKEHFLATLKCESRFAYDAQGDDGNSLGVAQISMKYHPEVTRAEALDPDWALYWMAGEWVKGNAARWTCWRLLYGKGSSQ